MDATFRNSQKKATKPPFIPIVMFDNETARKQETLVIFGLEDYDHK